MVFVVRMSSSSPFSENTNGKNTLLFNWLLIDEVGEIRQNI